MRLLRAFTVAALSFTAAAANTAADTDDDATDAADATDDADDASDDALKKAVAQGRSLFLHAWTRGDALAAAHGGDGLGPSYNASSCVSCHESGGVGGGGGGHGNVVVVDGVVAHKHGPRLGKTAATLSRASLASLLSNVSGLNAPPGALGALTAGGGLGGLTSARGLGLGGLGTGRFPSSAGVTVARNPTALFGAGLIDDIPDDVISDGAGVSFAGHPEIHGRVGRTPEGRVARFGWKGDVPDLVTFVSRACSIELGLEVPGSPQPGRTRPKGYDLDLDELEALVSYVRALPKPVEEARDNFAAEGAELFDTIGCTACHRAAVGDVDGIYSDLLLHEMGEQLDDIGDTGYYGAPPTAQSGQWRTPPLWGVRDSGPWLHDGRATTLESAIRAHGGEAARVRATWAHLDDTSQQAVIAFLDSLQAPR